MPTETPHYSHGIHVVNKRGDLVTTVRFPDLDQARKAVDPEYTTWMEEDAAKEGLLRGQVDAKVMAEFITRRLFATVLGPLSGHILTRHRKSNFNDFMAEHFAETVKAQTAFVDFGYRMMGLDPLKGDPLVRFFPHPMFSYEENGHVRGNALWDEMHKMFTVQLKTHTDSLAQKRESTQNAAFDHAKRNAKRKAASKARKASKRK